MVKNPTSNDLKILNYLKLGKKLHHVDALQLFRTIGLRDTVYRLRSAGYPIQSERVNYRTSQGKHKWYINYFMNANTATNA